MDPISIRILRSLIRATAVCTSSPIVALIELQGLESPYQGINLGDQLLLTLDCEGLAATFQESDLLFSVVFHDRHAGFLTLLDEGSDLQVVLLELFLNQLQVIVEPVSQLTQAVINLQLDFLLEPACEN